MKTVYLVMGLLGLMSCFTGLSNVIAGIAERGITGVNYGQVIFPLMLAVVSFWMFIRKK